MGLIQRAYETYCAMEQKYAGRYIAEQREPLAPISHLLTSADIEITLDVNGRFACIRPVDEIGRESHEVNLDVTFYLVDL